MALSTVHKLCATTALIFVSATGMAAASDFYIEGQLGSVGFKDASTQTISAEAFGLTLTDAQLTFSYDSDIFLGLEIGYNVSPSVRIGLSYSSFSSKWTSFKIAGTVTNGTDDVDISLPFTRADLDEPEDADSKVKLMMANAYYDIPLNGAVVPFFGVGIGKANISNATNETALSLSAGANYHLDENNYLGVKYTMTSINGPTDGVGFKYNDVKANAFNISYGYRF